MLLHPRSKDRPFHLGPFPLESLAARRRRHRARSRPGGNPGSRRARSGGRTMCCCVLRTTTAKSSRSSPKGRRPMRRRRCRTISNVARSISRAAPISWMPGAPASAGFLRMPGWPAAAKLPHDFALVVMVEHPRRPEADNLAHEWTRTAVAATADMRAAEIACCLAEYIRHMGFEARAHVAGEQLAGRRPARRARGPCRAPRRGDREPVSSASASRWRRCRRTMRWRSICRCGQTRSRRRDWRTGGASTARNPAENAIAGRGGRPTSAPTRWKPSSGWIARPP